MPCDSRGVQVGAEPSVKELETAVTRKLHLFSLGTQLSTEPRMVRISSMFSAAIQVSVKVLKG